MKEFNNTWVCDDDNDDDNDDDHSIIVILFVKFITGRQLIGMGRTLGVTG